MLLKANAMATADQIKALVKSHSEGDDERFYSVALQVAANEARKGRSEFAAELRDLIDRIRARAAARPGENVPIPLAAPRGELAELLGVSYPETRVDDMVLAPDLRRRLERILDEQRQIGLLKGHNLHPRQRLLLTGPPGCGKTMTASALAGELGIPLFVVRLDGLITKYMGETTVKLRLIFDAMERTRAVYLFDEFDSIGTDRGHGSDVGEIRRVLNSFLMFIERYSGTSLIVAATNMAKNLDKALFRRFDDLIEFQLPEPSLIEETMKRRLATVPGKLSVNFKRSVSEAKGMSFGEIVKACDEAMKECLLGNRQDLSTDDLVRSIRERRNFLRQSE
jgi:SpoVK/Ycf46/Vps4 family AAA+-type ATPase